MTNTTNPKKTLPRGAIPSPRSALAAAHPYVPDPSAVAPLSLLMWPCQMSYWGNDKYGDCVTAEEAFAKATAQPQTFMMDTLWLSWANSHKFLNGATLVDVMSAMNTDGIDDFFFGNYKDGSFNSVDWTDATTLQHAIYTNGPVKLGVASGHMEDNSNGHVTGGSNGWTMYGYPPDSDEDHCVSLCGYGTFESLCGLFELGGVKPKQPDGMPQGLCYAMFTWNSIGIVDEQSMLNMTHEAWVRTPVTVPTSGVLANSPG